MQMENQQMIAILGVVFAFVFGFAGKFLFPGIESNS
jgi:hypothetical protein